MAVNILAQTTRIYIVAGFESGHTMVFVQTDPGASFEKLYCAQSHTQPGPLPILKFLLHSIWTLAVDSPPQSCPW